MAKVSVLITARNEQFLPRMVHDLYEKLTGDFEVLVAFDGPPFQALPEHPGLRVFGRDYAGLKPQVNFLASQADGKYLLKFDAHCMVSEGIDEVLQRSMEPNWIVTPRFYVLDAENWKWQDGRIYDYFRLICPLTDPHGYRFQAGGHCRRHSLRHQDKLCDDTMQIHGSAWFVERDFFLNKLGGMQSVGYGNMFMEPPELCLKTWLGPWGGAVKVNKECWYAHAHKGGQRPRGYPIDMAEVRRSYLWTANYWMRNCWSERARDIGWLIDKFMPLPGWPENWRELQAVYENEHPYAP